MNTMNSIDLDLPVAQTLDQHPELLDLLVDLGFKPLANPVARRTLGNIVPLRRGCRLIALDEADLIRQLEWNGYQVKGVDKDD